MGSSRTTGRLGATPERPSPPATSPRLPVALGALGGIAIAFSGIFVRVAEVTPTTSAVFRCLYALPVLALLAARERSVSGPRLAGARRLSLLAGVAFAVDLVCWHYAIDAVGAGLATVLANQQVAIVGLVAWAALGERPSRATLRAIPIMLFGVVLISGVLGGGAYGDDPVLGAVLGLIAAAGYAGFLLLLRAANRGQQHRAAALFDSTLVGAIGALLAGLALGNVDLVPSWPAHGWLVLLALNSQVIGWMLISYALPRLPAVLTSVLLLLQPASAVLLGMVLLDEAPSLVQLLGVGLVLVGIVVATASDTAGRRRHPPA
ncbi:MAG TPA: DMT family transporter [Euzebyales bacterium]|nr:DMT family transporter [Euzebyales bacterium]